MLKTFSYLLTVTITLFVIDVNIEYCKAKTIARSYLSKNCNPESGNTTSEACYTVLVSSISILNLGRKSQTEEVEVRLVYDMEDRMQVRLVDSFLVKFEFKPTLLRYPITYIQSVNSRPFEMVTNRSSIKFKGCQFGVKCSAQYDDGGRPLSDEGFCCTCSDGKMSMNSSNRGGQVCQTYAGHTQDTLHCLRFDALWYNVYTLGRPRLSSNVLVTLFKQKVEQDGESWVRLTRGSTLNLQTKKGKGAATYKSITGYVSLNKPEKENLRIDASKYLLVPREEKNGFQSSSHWKKLMKKPENYLLLDKKYVDLSGLKCNKIGISQSAFNRQENPCVQPPQSCLHNQPYHFVASGQNTSKEFILGTYAEPIKKPIAVQDEAGRLALTVYYSAPHWVDFQISMHNGDFTVVRRGKTAQITTVYTLSSGADADVKVLITNNRSSDYIDASLKISQCQDGRGDKSTENMIIPAYGNGAFQIFYRGLKIDINETYCWVDVLSHAVVIARRLVLFQKNRRCACVERCRCACFPPGRSESDMRCDPMDENESKMAGFTGSHTELDQIKFKKSSKYKVVTTMLLVLFILGLLKAVLGLFSEPIAYFGIKFSGTHRKLRWRFQEIQNAEDISRMKLFFFNLFSVFCIPYSGAARLVTICKDKYGKRESCQSEGTEMDVLLNSEKACMVGGVQEFVRENVDKFQKCNVGTCSSDVYDNIQQNPYKSESLASSVLSYSTSDDCINERSAVATAKSSAASNACMPSNSTSKEQQFGHKQHGASAPGPALAALNRRYSQSKMLKKLAQAGQTSELSKEIKRQVRRQKQQSPNQNSNSNHLAITPRKQLNQTESQDQRQVPVKFSTQNTNNNSQTSLTKSASYENDTDNLGNTSLEPYTCGEILDSWQQPLQVANAAYLFIPPIIGSKQQSQEIGHLCLREDSEFLNNKEVLTKVAASGESTTKRQIVGQCGNLQGQETRPFKVPLLPSFQKTDAHCTYGKNNPSQKSVSANELEKTSALKILEARASSSLDTCKISVPQLDEMEKAQKDQAKTGGSGDYQEDQFSDITSDNESIITVIEMSDETAVKGMSHLAGEMPHLHEASTEGNGSNEVQMQDNMEEPEYEHKRPKLRETKSEEQPRKKASKTRLFKPKFKQKQQHQHEESELCCTGQLVKARSEAGALDDKPGKLKLRNISPTEIKQHRNPRQFRLFKPRSVDHQNALTEYEKQKKNLNELTPKKEK